MNELDEVTGPVKAEGRDINVIDKQLKIEVGVGSTVFEVILWCLAIIPGLIFLLVKIRAGNYLSQLQQKIQHHASEVDNYLEQRVQILKNTAKLVDKAIDFDKSTYTEIASLRSGTPLSDGDAAAVDAIERANAKLYAVMENYPQLQAHEEINNALNQNNRLQRDITAARTIYNDAVLEWNTAVYQWPAKMIVAARRGYTTRIPYSVSKETKEAARDTFF